jgi:hydrogenase expression/formation protein HypD
MKELMMKYVDEFRESKHILKLADLIKKSVSGEYTFMEVCGGHTAAIHRFGIPSLLPAGIRLISGPGCPVCVTATEYIDRLIALALTGGVTVATFGDLIRVPGSVMSLAAAAGEGADVRIVLSAFDALELARSHPEMKVIFPAIGFETTAPGTAVTVAEAYRTGDSNFFVLSAHKVMPPAMEELIRDGARLDGFLCPGHVSVITGSAAFEFIAEEYSLGCVITGFEPTDILSAILMLVRQINSNAPEVQIQYNRAVTREGNTKAQKYMSEVFEPCDAEWRGLGTIRSGGLRLRDKYSMFDAGMAFDIDVPHYERSSACICGDILRGVSTPDDCPLFATVCNPDHPEGACMVSDEGACNTFYKYHIHE